MTREEIINDYEVSENGIIQSPGKFESEMLYAPFFYDVMMNGLGDETLADNSELFELTDEDRTRFPELETYAFAVLSVSNSGFVYVELTNDDPRDEETQTFECPDCGMDLATEDETCDCSDDDKPDDEDGFIVDRPFRGYDVIFARKFIGNFKERDEAEDVLTTLIKRGNFYPNCWFIDDHGGHLLISVNEDGQYFAQ